MNYHVARKNDDKEEYVVRRVLPSSRDEDAGLNSGCIVTIHLFLTDNCKRSVVFSSEHDHNIADLVACGMLVMVPRINQQNIDSPNLGSLTTLSLDVNHIIIYGENHNYMGKR